MILLMVLMIPQCRRTQNNVIHPLILSLITQRLELLHKSDITTTLSMSIFLRKSKYPRQRLAGGKHVGYSESVYRSERKTADRNFALAYFMNEKSGKRNVWKCLINYM
jgi:hypothetical protein